MGVAPLTLEPPTRIPLSLSLSNASALKLRLGTAPPSLTASELPRTEISERRFTLFLVACESRLDNPEGDESALRFFIKLRLVLAAPAVSAAVRYVVGGGMGFFVLGWVTKRFSGSWVARLVCLPSNWIASQVELPLRLEIRGRGEPWERPFSELSDNLMLRPKTRCF